MAGSRIRIVKYDVDLALDDPNTSHAVVVDLVGADHRVLDVGCSTGALGRALRARSNRVWGVEIDPEAARLAEADLEQVVVGDIETMDLQEHFERASFDVIIFADVLEHLRDPVAALQKALELLAPGGSVVVSLPNVAHGSVRLALLEGRFEYRPLGLLDDTHLRFFTRRSVEDLLHTAGLIAVDMRRTTADVFETEIPLAPDQFDRKLIERLRAEPDSDTYQFVFRAVPAADGQVGDLTNELVARNEELSALRSEVTRIHALAERFAPPHSVGVLVDAEAAGRRPWASLRTAITSVELRRRIDHLALVHLSGDPEGDPATWRGEPVEGLGRLDDAAAELLASAYDAIVLAGDDAPEAGRDFCADLVERGCPVVPFGVSRRPLEALAGVLREGAVRAGREGRDGALPGLIAVPDPLVLADHLVAGQALSPRLDYLDLTGRVAVRRPYLVVSVSAERPDLLPALGRTLTELGSATGCQIVVLAGPSGAGPVEALVRAVPGACGLGDPQEIDVLALVHQARLVVTDAAPVAAVALALHRAVLAFGADEELLDLAEWSCDPDLVVKTPAEILGRIGLADARAQDETLVARLQAPLELAYDEVAAALRGASARRLSVSMTEILELHRSRIAALEQANAALQARLVAERNSLGARAVELSSGRGDREPPTPLELAEMQHRIAAAEARVGEEWALRQEELKQLGEAHQIIHRLQGELDAVMSTRTMKVLSPARKLYGRLRRL